MSKIVSYVISDDFLFPHQIGFWSVSKLPIPSMAIFPSSVDVTGYGVYLCLETLIWRINKGWEVKENTMVLICTAPPAY